MVVKESRHYHFQSLEFWAEAGMVFIVDTERAGNSANQEQEVFQVTPGEFIKRAMAVRVTTGDDYADEAFAARQLLERAVEVAKIAKAQGDLTDPAVQEHFSKHERKTQILVPGMSTLNAPQKLRATGDSASIMLRGAYEVVPDILGG